MNHQPRTASPLLICLLASSLLLTGAAQAQTPAAAAAPSTPAAALVPIPPAAKSAPDATTAATFKAQIDLFVKQQVARLADTKTPNSTRRARDLLEQQASGQPTASFLLVYATSLDANIQSLSTSKDLVVRLNAAIVVARVAAKAQNAALAPSALKFMNDPSDAVALWGVKAAKAIIPVVLNLNGAAPDTLTPALINVVKKNWFSGAIAYEAYDALRLNTAGPSVAGAAIAPGTVPPANNGAIQAAVGPMLGLMAFRSDLYAKGVPPLPTAEGLPISFLTNSKVWGLLTDAQRLQVVQQLVNVTSLAGKHCEVATPEVRNALVVVIPAAGGGLQVIGDNAKDPATSDAAKPLRQIGTPTPADVIVSTTDAFVTTISASPKWKGLKAPPAPVEAGKGKLLSPSEPLDDAPDAPAATTAGGNSGGAAQ